MSVNNNTKLPSDRQTTMFSSAWIVGIVLFGAATGQTPQMPDPKNITTCEEFERGARFSPYRVVDAMWKIFYYWSPNKDLYPVYFSIPAKQSILRFKELYEAVTPGIVVEWEKASLLMEPRPGVEILMLYGGTPGAYRALVKQERRTKVRPHPLPLTTMADVRMKLVGKWLGIMCCEDYSAFALARVDELPTTEEQCADAATELGFIPSAGNSYLKYLKKEL